MPTLTTHLEVDIGGGDYACPTVCIDYDYSPGCGAYTYPGEYAPTDPPDPAEVSFISAEVIDPDGTTLTALEVQNLAAAYLSSNAGWRDAVYNAEQQSRGDPDAAYDEWRDEGRGNAWTLQIDDF